MIKKKKQLKKKTIVDSQTVEPRHTLINSMNEQREKESLSEKKNEKKRIYSVIS